VDRVGVADRLAGCDAVVLDGLAPAGDAGDGRPCVAAVGAAHDDAVGPDREADQAAVLELDVLEDGRRHGRLLLEDPADAAEDLARARRVPEAVGALVLDRGDVLGRAGRDLRPRRRVCAGGERCECERGEGQTTSHP